MELCASSVVYDDCWWNCSSVQGFIMNEGGLCSCLEVYFDCRWNHSSFQQSILIVGGFVRMSRGLC